MSPEAARFAAAIDALEAAALELQQADLGVLGAPGLLELNKELARTEALVASARTRIVNRADLLGATEWDGLRSMSAWLVHNTQASGSAAARQVKRGRALRQLPVVANAFARGLLSVDQVDHFVRALNDRTAEALRVDQELLVDLAGRLTADQFGREMRGWAERADTDGAEPDPGHTSRGFTMSQGFDGRWNGAFTLGSGDGALVGAAVDARVAELFEQDQRDGVVRSATQRRADALRDLVLGQAKPRVTLDLVLNADDLDAGACSSRLVSNTNNATVGGGFVTAADTLRLAVDAAYRAVVTDPFGGAVLHFGRRRRLASDLQRHAVAIETGGVCGFTGCDNPIDTVHHIVEWEHGGSTDLPQLVGVCHGHHDEIHEGGWTVDKSPEGHLRWRRPDGSPLRSAPGWRPPPDPSDTASPMPPASVMADVLRVRERARALRDAA